MTDSYFAETLLSIYTANKLVSVPKTN